MNGADEVGTPEELDDTALRQEIELLGELIETVAEAGHPLCQAEVDRALHVTQPPVASPVAGAPSLAEGAA
jgi:hypothetical protein